MASVSPLTRSIGLTQATAMVVGTIVGSSIFVQPSEVSRAVPTFAGMLLVWVVAGTLTAVTEERLIDYFAVPPDKPTVVEFVEHLESQNCIRIVADRLGALPPEVEKIGAIPIVAAQRFLQRERPA